MYITQLIWEKKSKYFLIVDFSKTIYLKINSNVAEKIATFFWLVLMLKEIFISLKIKKFLYLSLEEDCVCFCSVSECNLHVFGACCGCCSTGLVFGLKTSIYNRNLIFACLVMKTNLITKQVNN